MKRIFCIFLIITLLGQSIALSDGHTVTIRAPAVRKTETGLEGVLSSITVSARPGSGHVFMDTWPMTQIDMQGSARLAVNVASEVTGQDQDKYDFYITFRSDSPVIGGPSAGGAMTVALIAALQGWNIKDDVMMTGMINPDGSIGPIGGVLEKAGVAHENGITLFLIPEGQKVITVQNTQTKTIGPFTILTANPTKVDVVEYAKKNWGLEVREVYDITDAVFYFTGNRLPSPQRSQASPDTYPMRPAAQSEIEKASSLLSQTEKNLDTYKGTYRGDFAQILADGNSSLMSARQNFESKKYFTALSNAFDAETSIEFAGNLLNYVVSKDTKTITDLLGETQKLLEEKRKETITGNFYGITYLECMATAQLQVGEAEDFISKAKELFNNNSLVNSIYYLSMAKQKLQSSSFWAQIAQTYKTTTPIPSSKIQNVADTMINNAELSNVYASELLGSNVAVIKSGELVAKSKSEFEKGEYAASLFDAIQARVYANTAVEMLTSGEDVLKQRLEVAQSDAETAIAVSRGKGIEPLLASSYFELAGTLKQKDAVSSMVYFKYAKEAGYVFKYLEASPEIPSQETSSQQTKETMPPLQGFTESTTPKITIQTGIVLAVIFFFGFLAGIFVRAKYK